jgi:hypothetical protein
MLKKLALTSLVLLALKGGYAQTNSLQNVLPKVPDFYREYSPSISNWFIDANGKISWNSKHYMKNNDYIREIRGYCNLDVSFLLIGVEKVYVGFISRLNMNKNILETIVYNNGSNDRSISQYDSLLAITENIDLNSAKEIYHEIINYNSREVTNMETSETDTLLDNAMSFQEAYFKVPKDRNSSVNVRFRGKTRTFQTEMKSDDGEKYIFIDLTMLDPEHPGKKINVVDRVTNLKLYSDDKGIPWKVIARVKTPIGETNVKAEYDP